MSSAPRPDPKKTPRPDPQKGVFETLLVAGGRPVELEAHLARLAASLRDLFGAEPGEKARDLVLGRAAGLRLGRLRLTATPRGGGVELEAHGEEVEPSLVFPAAERAAALRSFAVPGGLGPHKWADRSLLEQMEATMSDGGQAKATATAEGPTAAPVPLLLDRDGSVLEASRANVFAVRGGALVTPPADGRILPGVARACAIEVARAAGVELREEALAPADLASAEEVFLTGSVRGVEPAGSLDGAELQPAGAVTRLVAAGLQRRWLDP
jgi:para-aminobenzoate synthetase / 4-amino-4-deoxychorismate lyase